MGNKRRRKARNKKSLVVVCNTLKPPLGPLIVMGMASIPIDAHWREYDSMIQHGTFVFKTEASMCRYIVRSDPKLELLYGSNIIESAEVDSWLTIGMSMKFPHMFGEQIIYLQNALSTRTYLVGNTITLADIYLWSILFRDARWNDILHKEKKYINVCRWYYFIETSVYVQKMLSRLYTMANFETLITAFF